MRKVDPELIELQKNWTAILYQQGFNMLNDENLAKKQFRAMEDFIAFKKRSDDLVQRVFHNDFKNKIVAKAFEQFLNIDSNIVAEYLAKYLDFWLKK